MLDELDFRKEAKNIEDFTTFLDRAGIVDAVAPKVCVSVSPPPTLPNPPDDAHSTRVPSRIRAHVFEWVRLCRALGSVNPGATRRFRVLLKVSSLSN